MFGANPPSLPAALPRRCLVPRIAKSGRILKLDEPIGLEASGVGGVSAHFREMAPSSMEALTSFPFASLCIILYPIGSQQLHCKISWYCELSRSSV